MPNPNPAELGLPYLHPKVELSDLDINGKLFSDAQISAMQKELKDKPDGRYPKNSAGQKFDVIKLDGELYAIYEGAGKSKSLGEGAQGKIELVQKLSAGNWYALKVGAGSLLELTEDVEEAKAIMEDEHKVLKKMGRASGEVFAHEKEFGPGDVRVQFHSMMELASGSNLEEFVKARSDSPPIPAVRWLEIAVGMMNSVSQFQAMGYLHRDLKLDNFMYDFSRQMVTLIDFGAAAAKNENGEFQGKLIGTPGYMAPEIKGGSIVYNEKSEVYAMGIALKRMLGFEPIPNRDGPDFLNPTPFQHDMHMLAFLNSMTSDDPADRPSMQKATRYFQLAQQELLHLSHATVGILDINAFIAADEKQRASFIAALKEVDEVKLVVGDRKNISDLQLIEAQRELMAAGINISNPSRDSISTIRSYFHFVSPEEKRAVDGIPQIVVNHDDGKVYRGQIDESLAKKTIAPEDFKRVIDTLKSEQARLQIQYSLEGKNRYSDSASIQIARGRIELLKRVIVQMEDPLTKSRMTYGAMAETLGTLGTRMVGTNWLSRKLGIKSTSRSNIENLIESLDVGEKSPSKLRK